MSTILSLMMMNKEYLRYDYDYNNDEYSSFNDDGGEAWREAHEAHLAKLAAKSKPEVSEQWILDESSENGERQFFAHRWKPFGFHFDLRSLQTRVQMAAQTS